MNIKFPDDVAEADTRIATLKADIRSIQDQLGKRRLRKNCGSEEVRRHMAWRKKAIDALNFKINELSLLKNWRKNYYRGWGQRLREGVGADTMLYGMYRMCKRLLALGIKIHTEEQDVLDTVQAHLRNTGGNNDSSTEGRASQEDGA